MRLFLIRHAFTFPRGPDSRLWHLSPEGRRQAKRLAGAAFWSEVSAVYGSPQEKALATVRPSAAKYGLRTIPDERLREAERPATWYEDYESVVRGYLSLTKKAPEGWEEPFAVKSRIEECVRELEGRHPGQSVAVCSYGLAFALYLSGMPGSREGVVEFWEEIGFCRVAVLDGGVFETFREPEKVR